MKLFDFKFREFRFLSLEKKQEIKNNIQTEKIKRFPILLVGNEFWSGMVDWIKVVLLIENKINLEDLVTTSDKTQ